MAPKRSEGAEVPRSSRDSKKRRQTSPQSDNLRQGPGPTTSTRGGQAAGDPSSRQSGAPVAASSRIDRELQAATTSIASLSVFAHAPPPSSTPAWETRSHASIHQPQIPFPSSQHGPSGPYVFSQHGPSGPYVSNQPGQSNAYQSEQARFYQPPIHPSPYLHNSTATGMGTASAAPVGHQPETRDPQPVDADDEELVFLTGQYDNRHDKWALVVQGLERKGFTNRTQADCEWHWNNVLKAKNPNFKPADWSKEEDNRLTELVKNFDQWDALNGWYEISDRMRAEGFGRAPENCRGRWRETLRGPAKTGAWSKEEQKLLRQLEPLHHHLDVLVDLLERDLGSIRTVEQCSGKVDRLRKNKGITFSQENTSDSSPWSPDADQKLTDFNRGRKNGNHKAAAEKLNQVFDTDFFTPLECEKRWRVIKRQQRG